MGSRPCLASELFCGQPSTYLWEDDSGEVRTIPQGALASTLLSPQRRPSWNRERSSSRTWTIFTSFADRRGLEPSSISWRGRCGIGVGFSLQHQWGFKVLGIPLGASRFRATVLGGKIAEHRVLLERIPEVPDTQSAWLLLSFCAAARANFFLRGVNLDHAKWFAAAHDQGVWQCFCRIMQILPICGAQAHEVS